MKNRTIKFRAWHKITKSMLDWEELIKYSNDQFKIVKTVNFFEDEELEIMQFTGLRDKNGKEIYEGDIVKYKKHGEREVTRFVRFDECEFIIATIKQNI